MAGTLLAVIPARGGSKRIPHKNMRLLGGKTLVVHAIECARGCNLVTRLVVSTDSPEIRRVAEEAGADAPFLRPAALATDTATTAAVVAHAAAYLWENEGARYGYFVVLEPTSPFRIPSDINDAFALLSATGADSVVGVTHTPVHPSLFCVLDHGWLQPAFSAPELKADDSGLLKINGAIYLSHMEVLARTGQIMGGRVVPYLMPDLRSLDIDNMHDLYLAELLLAKTGGFAHDPHGCGQTPRY